MVEMLGVLTITGVLTIASIKAFHTVMNRLQINNIRSWLTLAELALLEHCFYNDNNSCAGYLPPRNVLCGTLGKDYCPLETDSPTSAYVHFKPISNIQWAIKVEEKTWNITFSHLTEEQCAMILQMGLPQNVYRMNTTASITFTSKPPVLTNAHYQSMLTTCRNSAQTGNNGGFITFSFATK